MHATYKDFAEFFRLGLLADVCELSSVARWADSVIAAESEPALAFINLTYCESQTLRTVVDHLAEVPGYFDPDLPAKMLAGHCHQLVTSGSLAAVEALDRLYRVVRAELYLTDVYDGLVSLDQDLYLAREGINGTVAEVQQAVVAYLARFASFAPTLLPIASEEPPPI